MASTKLAKQELKQQPTKPALRHIREIAASEQGEVINTPRRPKPPKATDPYTKDPPKKSKKKTPSSTPTGAKRARPKSASQHQEKDKKNHKEKAKKKSSTSEPELKKRKKDATETKPTAKTIKPTRKEAKKDTSKATEKSKPEPSPKSVTAFGLPLTSTKLSLCQVFGPYGTITDIRMIKTDDASKSFCGYVIFLYRDFLN
jgi:hypothetical protein